MKHLVAAVILSRPDYCNSVLAGLPWSTVASLQRVQNAAARLVLSLPPCDHVSSAFVELHWLPIRYRIQFKLALLMHMAHNNKSPAYISDVTLPVSRDLSRSRLRSADNTAFIVPRTRTKFGESAFCVSGPTIWNSLPESNNNMYCYIQVSSEDSLFKHFFITAVNLLFIFYCLFYCHADPVRCRPATKRNDDDDDDDDGTVSL